MTYEINPDLLHASSQPIDSNRAPDLKCIFTTASSSPFISKVSTVYITHSWFHYYETFNKRKLVITLNIAEGSLYINNKYSSHFNLLVRKINYFEALINQQEVTCYYQHNKTKLPHRSSIIHHYFSKLNIPQANAFIQTNNTKVLHTLITHISSITEFIDSNVDKKNELETRKNIQDTVSAMIPNNATNLYIKPKASSKHAIHLNISPSSIELSHMPDQSMNGLYHVKTHTLQNTKTHAKEEFFDCLCDSLDALSENLADYSISKD